MYLRSELYTGAIANDADCWAIANPMQKLLPYNKSLGEVRRKEIREPLEDELSHTYFCLVPFAEADLGADGLTTMLW